MRTTPEVIAHRGASAYRPEHTWAAYDLALEQGTDVLELDLRCTQDGEVVVLHDATLGRTHGDPRAVITVPLRRLPALPTLREVLQRYGDRARLLLELKAPFAPAGATADLVRAAGLQDRCVVQSFDHQALAAVSRRAPALAVATLHDGRPPAAELDRLARGGVEGVGILHRLVDHRLVREAHARGLRVRAYTANAPADLRRLAELEVDGLISDVPDLARATVQAVALADATATAAARTRA